MHTNVATLFRAAVALVSLAGFAIAGPLPTDPNALAAWRGSTLFTNGGSLKVDVEYAVYAPGQFDTSAALGFPSHVPVDPSGGTQYVYAYELFNNVGGTFVDLNLSVGVAVGGIPNGSTNITNDPGTPEGGVPPNHSEFIPGSDPEQAAKWSYDSGLAVGAHSDILLFTSPFGPQFFQSSMQGGHATVASSQLPSPVPEPAGVVLAVIGAAMVSLLARWRRKAA